MKITSIKQQVKRMDRYAIYIDAKYVFSLGANELLSSGLRVGQELTKSELGVLQEKAKLDKAYDRVLNLLSLRARSEWEIRFYLQRKEYTQDVTEPILNKLRNRGLVDDLAFAKSWVDNRRLLKATSKRRLQAELRQKRINSEIINQVLQADETDEQQVLRELIEHKRARYPDRLKLMQYLARQGYNYDDIKAVLNEDD